MSPKLWPLLLAGVLAGSVLTVYTQYVFLHTTDDVTHRAFRDQSLEQYSQILNGTRPFPYQWRVAGPRLVRLGETITGLDPHVIDAMLKTAALAVSALFLIRFASLYVSPLGTVVVVALYFLLTAAAYSSEGYSIYYSNDFLMVAGWNASVALIALGQWPAVALVVFLTAWAKETVVLIVLLAILQWRRGRATLTQVALCLVPFAIPTALLRFSYPAPLSEWAWWHNVTLNVPFLRMERDAVSTALRDHGKLIVFFNIWGGLALWTWSKTRDPLLRDLGYVSLVYLAIMYVVVYLRELRHFLPLLIIVLPMAVSELEQLLEKRTLRQPPAMQPPG